MDDFKTIALTLVIFFFAVRLSWVLISNLPPKLIMKKEHDGLYDLYAKTSIPPWRTLNNLGKSIEALFWAGGAAGLIITTVIIYKCLTSE